MAGDHTQLVVVIGASAGQAKKMIISERIVCEYLTQRGLTPQQFTKAEMRKGRTPDFRVRHKDKLAFYCEVKHSQKDR